MITSTLPTRTFLDRLASWCFRHRRVVVLIWILALPSSFAVSGALGGKFNNSQGEGGGTESSKAIEVFSREFPQGEAQSNGEAGEIVFRVDDGVASKQTEISAWLDGFAKNTIVATVTNPFTATQPGQISPDGTVGLSQVTFKPGVDVATEPLKLIKTAKPLRDLGVSTEFAGFPFAGFSVPPSEAFGLLAAVIILVLAFGSIMAMGLPILTAILGVGIAVAGVGIWSFFADMPSFVTSITAMIGLGVGIDYVLFIVTRYKDEVHEGRNPHDATVRSINTAGRAVVFAGCTVIISMLGMFLMGLSFINGIAIAGATPVFVIVLAAVTLLPAMLGFIGHNINKWSIHRNTGTPKDHETGWHRWSRFVQRRAWPFAIGGLVVLIVTSIPLLSLRLGSSDQGNNAKDNTTRKAYDMKAAAFGPGSNAPGLLVIETPTPESVAVVATIEAAVKATPGVASASTQPLPSGKAFLINFTPTTGPQEVATENLVHHLRKNVIAPIIAGSGATAYLGGFTATGIDFASLIGARLPLFIGVVLILSFLLLMAVFRSILVPLKAVIMNLLSIGAAYGLVVAVFQWGWGGSLLGVGKPGPIEPWIPMMMFAIVFGLSMDYEVFLLSRIREHYDHHRNNGTAVVEGLASTARVITAAAAIMVCVFLGFALGDRAIKVMGVGLATAVFIDATIVRIIMVPATMELLGDRNWWFPRWLDKTIPKINVELNNELTH